MPHDVYYDEEDKEICTMAMLNHDYMLNFFGKIYDLSNTSPRFKKKFKIECVDSYSSGNKRIKTDFCTIIFNNDQDSTRLLVVYLNKVMVYDASGQSSDRYEKTRSEKETNLILKQILFFEDVYNKHLDKQSEELSVGPEETEEVTSLEKSSTEESDVVPYKEITTSAEYNWFISSVCSVSIYITGSLVTLSPPLMICLVMLNYLFFLGCYIRERRTQKALYAKRKKDVPQKIIEEPVLSELDIINKELDRKNDAVDAVMKALSDL